MVVKRVIKLLISICYWALNRIWCGIQSVLGKRDLRIATILYYHAIHQHEREKFAQQMGWLINCAIPIQCDGDSHAADSRYRVAVTFDDGYQNICENAIPELMRRQIPVTVFVATGYIGKLAGWIKKEDSRHKNGPIMDVKHLQSMKSKLITIGSHTITHPRLCGLLENEAFHELHQSKKELESILEKDVDLFSFPHGEYSDSIINMCRECGYRRVFSITPAFAFTDSDEYLTGRVGVDVKDWWLEFQLKLRGGYNWGIMLEKKS